MVDGDEARGEVAAAEHAVEEGQGGAGFVEGDRVATVVDAREGVGGGLLHDAVHGGGGGVVGRRDVFVAGGGEAWGGDLVGDFFAAELGKGV
jgi:hypothetical protein